MGSRSNTGILQIYKRFLTIPWDITDRYESKGWEGTHPVKPANDAGLPPLQGGELTFCVYPSLLHIVPNDHPVLPSREEKQSKIGQKSSESPSKTTAGLPLVANFQQLFYRSAEPVNYARRLPYGLLAGETNNCQT